MRRILTTPLKPIFFAPIIAVYTALWLAPAWIWYEPQSLIVAQDAPGTEPQVSLSRDIHFGFDGSYTVDVRVLDTSGIVCGKPGAHRYRGGLTGTFTTSLSDFAGGDTDCAALPDGVYFVEACWTVETPLWGILPAKTACITSNPFRVQGLAP